MGIEDLREQTTTGGSTSERGIPWKPKKEGEELAGIIETINYVHTDFGDKYVLNVRDEADDTVLWTLWVDGMVLKNRLLELAPGVGSLIVVLFNGKKDNKAGTYKYNDFQIAVDKPDCHDEWLAAKAAFTKRSLLKEDEARDSHGGGYGGGIAADDDDGMEAPF